MKSPGNQGIIASDIFNAYARWVRCAEFAAALKKSAQELAQVSGLLGVAHLSAERSDLLGQLRQEAMARFLALL